MPARAGIHLFFGVVLRCLEMDSDLRRNDIVILAPIKPIALPHRGVPGEDLIQNLSKKQGLSLPELGGFPAFPCMATG